MKKILAVALAVLMLLSMAACGKKESNKKGVSDLGANGLLIGTNKAEIGLGTPEKTLDPAETYENLEYDNRMFYGKYRILGGEAGEAEYAAAVSYVDSDLSNLYADKISSIPYALEAGPNTLNHRINSVSGREFLRAYFYTDSGNMTFNLCEYTVSGNTITLKLVDKLEYNEDNTHVRIFMSDLTFTYTFSFEGRKLTLTDGTDTVEMYSGLDVYDDDLFISVDNYIAEGEERLMDFDYMYLLYMDNGEYSTVYVEDMNNNDVRYGLVKLEENGIATITVPKSASEELETCQMVYFLCADDGIILTDGTKTYFYTQSRSQRYGNGLDANLSFEDVQKLENMSEEKLEEIVRKKGELLTDLTAAFKEAGIDVTVNEQTGEITFEASVLFPVDGYEVSEEGKDLLGRFMSVYVGVLTDEKYNNFISSIVIEGHTDSTGEYDYNLTLSQNRADSVKNFCLSPACSANAADLNLSEMLQAVGYSSDRLILDASGNEDKDASRRVCFRFVINLDA